MGAFPDQPEGFGGARWGMGVEAVRSVFPELRPRGAPRSIEGLDLALETHVSAGHEVLGASGCTVRFFFANDQLYRLGFVCDAAAVEEKLYERHGEPDLRLGTDVHWTNETRAVSLRVGTGNFSYTDRTRDAAVQLGLLKAAALAGQKAAQQEPEPAPQESPAARPEALAALQRLPDLPPGWLEEPGRRESELRELAAAETPEMLMYRIGNVGLFQEVEDAPLLARYLEHEDEGVFEASAAALETIGQEASVRALGRRLAAEDTPSARKLRLIEALMLLRDEPATASEIARALGDADAEVRRDASMTLAVISGPEIAPAVRRALEHEGDELTRRVLERTLEILADPEARKGRPPSG